MRRVLLALALLFVAVQATAQQFTTNLQLQLPPRSALNWDAVMNANFSILDTAIGITQQPFAGAWSSATIYPKGAQVTFSGVFYYSLASNNLNNQPSTSPSFWVPAFSFIPSTASANNFFAGPTSGPAAAPGFRAMVTADLPTLPNPSASTLGGIESITCAASNWINNISTAGVPSCAQPGFTNISGLIFSTQYQYNTSAKAGTSYTVLSSDRGSILTFSNTSAVTVTLPSAATLNAGWTAYFFNLNTGPVIINSSSSFSSGGTSVTLWQGYGLFVVSDGTVFEDGFFSPPTVSVNAQSGNYTLVANDYGKLVTDSASGTITLPAANSTGFGAGWNAYIENVSVNAGIQLVPASGTVDGKGSIFLSGHCGVLAVSDGTNWQTFRGNCPNIGFSGNTNAVANITNQTISTPNDQGMFLVACVETLTQAATTSSTFPSLTIGWTDLDSLQSKTFSFGGTSTANTVGTQNFGTTVVSTSGTITFSTAGYASSGATAMQYAVRCTVTILAAN